MCRQCVLLLTGTTPFFKLLQQVGFACRTTATITASRWPWRAGCEPAATGQRLPCTGQWRALQRQFACCPASRSGSPPASTRQQRHWLDRRYPRRPRCPQRHFWKNPLATRFWSAVKPAPARICAITGVSVFASLVRWAWVGNFNGEPMWDVSGVTGPRRLAGNHQPSARQPASPPPAPLAGLVAQQIAYLPPVEAARREWFVRGTQQALWQVNESGANPIRLSRQRQHHRA